MEQRPQLIQDVKITKHITPMPPAGININIDKYTMIIVYHDVVYSIQLDNSDFNSSLFGFDMLETLIYNCNHKQKVGDISCDMKITKLTSDIPPETKLLNIELLFERNVKPMKLINEIHTFKLKEKELNDDDKICLSLENLRNDINFITIKKTTKIYTYKILQIFTGSPMFKIIGHDTSLPFTYICTEPSIAEFYSNQQGGTGGTRILVNKNFNLTLLIQVDEHIKTFIDYKTNYTTYIQLRRYIFEKYLKFYKVRGNYIAKFLHNNVIKKLLQLETHYINNVIIDGDTIITFVDETKKSNNRNIKYFETMADFIETREPFTTYNILYKCGSRYLIEEFV